jgi:hypothetical protein
MDEHNHALDALRYLVRGLDAHKMARWGKWWGKKEETPPATPTPAQKTQKKWLSIWNEALWTPIYFD